MEVNGACGALCAACLSGETETLQCDRRELIATRRCETAGGNGIPPLTSGGATKLTARRSTLARSALNCLTCARSTGAKFWVSALTRREMLAGATNDSAKDGDSWSCAR